MAKVTPIGNTYSIATSTSNAVANVATGTNTFRITNASASVYAYVGVYNDYATAAAATGASSGGTDAPLMLITPNESVVVSGNFGTNPNPQTVYVATITATGSTTVFATPVSQGSA